MMKVCSFALKGAVLLSFLTAPVYANQYPANLMSQMQELTVQQLSEMMIKQMRPEIVNSCRTGKRYNKELGISYFASMEKIFLKSRKNSRLPYDIDKKISEARNYAMYSVCPEVW